MLSNKVLKILKIVTGKSIDRYKISHTLLACIDKYIRKIIRKTVKYMIINKKQRFTILDIKQANLENIRIGFIQSNFIMIKLLNADSSLVPVLSKKRHFKNIYFDNIDIKPESFFIIKNWFLLNYKKDYSLFKNRLTSLFKLNINYDLDFKNIAFSLLLKKEFTFYKYFLSKLLNGNYIEKDFCLEIICKYKKINTLFPYLLLHLNEYIFGNNNTSFFHFKIVIKVIRALSINRSFNINVYFEFLLPILIKFITETFKRFSFEQNYSLKIYSANIIGIINNRLSNLSDNLYLKIIPIFTNIILKYQKNILELYGCIICISVLGIKNIELVLIPYLSKVIGYIDRELLEKSNKVAGKEQIKLLYDTIMSILISYCVKKKIKNFNNKKHKKIKNILFNLTKTKKPNEAGLNNMES